VTETLAPLTAINGGQPLALSLQLLLLMTVLAVLPSILLMMTSFTRIIIVLSILRQALGLQQSPPNQVLVGMALFLSLFVMRPVVDEVNRTAYQPYQAKQIAVEEAVARSGNALHKFMAGQVRKSDLDLFFKLAKAPKVAKAEDVPFSVEDCVSDRVSDFPAVSGD
jgi:flagellar biosynthesis protein FliP